MSEELKPCPECENEYLAIRTDIYKDKREFVYCDCCGCMTPKSVWNKVERTASTIPASEAGELPPLPKPECLVVGVYGYRESHMRAYGKECARAALASTRTASDTRTAAGEAECDAALGRAAPEVQHYAAELGTLTGPDQFHMVTSITTVPLAPTQKTVREALQAIHDAFKRDIDQGYKTRDKEFAVAIAANALSSTASTDAAAGAAAGGNTCKESVTSTSTKNGTESPETRMNTSSRTDVNSSADVDVEAERKLFEKEANDARFFPAEIDFTLTKSPSGQRDEYVNSHLQSRWEGWLAARTQADAGKAEPIGAVLAYSTRGHSKPCGQTIGANGAGDFVVIFHGTAEQSDVAARDYIRGYERAGYRFDSVILVRDEDGYHGPVIKHIDATTTKPENT